MSGDLRRGGGGGGGGGRGARRGAGTLQASLSGTLPKGCGRRKPTAGMWGSPCVWGGGGGGGEGG